MKNLLKDIVKVTITLGLLLGIGAGSVYQAMASATTLRVVQTPTVHLYIGEASNATTVRITPYPKDLDGNKLSMTDFGTLPTFTVDPKISGVEEIESFTGIIDNGDNTATLTGISHDLQSKYPYTGSGTGVQHGAGATVVFGNNPQLYGRLNSLENDQTATGITTFNIPPILNDANATSSAQAASRGFVLGILSGSTTIPVISGGTGVQTLPPLLLVGNGTNPVTGTSTPTVAAITATSTTATSTFAGGVTVGQSVTVSGNQTINGSLTVVGPITGAISVAPFGLLGNAADGNITYAGTTNLTQDVYAGNITVTGTVFTNGWRIFATGTVAVSNGGKISVEGRPGVLGGSGSTCTSPGAGGAAATSTGMLGFGSAGVSGTNSNTGTVTAAAKVVDSIGGPGGNGGASGATGQISPGGTASTTLARFLNITDAMSLTTYSTTTSSYVRANGGTGGGGGGGGNSDSGCGGGGGGAAGVLAIFAQNISVASGGTISAIGGAGGNGGTTNGAGGGGGGGGAIVLGYTGTYTNSGTVSVAGGAIGVSQGGGGTPVAGTSGKLIILKMQ